MSNGSSQFSCDEPFVIRVGMAGFEPTTSCTPSKCASQAALHPVAANCCRGTGSDADFRRRVNADCQLSR